MTPVSRSQCPIQRDHETASPRGRPEEETTMRPQDNQAAFLPENRAFAGVSGADLRDRKMRPWGDWQVSLGLAENWGMRPPLRISRAGMSRAYAAM